MAQQLLARLALGEPDPDVFARVGAPDPIGAAEAFLEVGRHADLAAVPERWAPQLLLSARPDFGARSLVRIADAARGAGRPLALERVPCLPQVLGARNFLARLLSRRPDWLSELEGAPPAAPSADEVALEWEAIRATKYRGLLRITARDLAGRAFAESLLELSDLADRCLTAGLALAARETDTQAPALLALGKLGGSELNYSSDVDLLFVYDPPADLDPLEYNHAVSRLIRHLKTQLELPTPEGFGYRVDLDLRPEGRTGVLVNSVDAALSYYESFGAEWERQMLLRLRAVAGPEAAASAFSEGIRPFVFRRLIDTRVLEHVRDMKTRIETERRQAGRDIDADVKEGPGGIRDVEFLVQSLQLFFGGREPGLRTGNVLLVLEELGRRELLPESVASALAGAYLWLRRVEHALQMVEERQKARFPDKPEEQLALARRLGYDEPEAASARASLLEDWTSVRNEVRGHFDALVLRETQ
ncbi:MAG: hypothetical protein ACR2P8_15115 [Myxococcota bacterium]